MKGIVITPENEISVKDFGEPLYQTIGEAVGGHIEHVHPRLLEDPFCMIVNEEGLLNLLPVNAVGSFLNETLMHGRPIVGTIVIMKDGYNEDGESDINGLTDEDINYMCGKLKRTFELKEAAEMSTDLIVVRQLPIIEDQLRSVHDTIQARVSSVLEMECTEETYKEVKKARSELNAQFRALEDRRKEVKAQIEAPYKQFELVYKACAGDLFAQADKQLAAKITAVESGLKQKKADAVRMYFDEYRDSLGIPADLVSYDHAGIVVTLSASAKSLKTQAKGFLDRVSGDLALIDTQEHKDEILVEYCKSLNVSQAVTAVTNRHAAIERQRRMREEMAATADQQRAAEKTVQRAVEAATPQPAKEEPAATVMPPVVVERTEDAEPPKQYSAAFRVTGSLDQLKALKKFLVDGGYVYEQLT